MPSLTVENYLKEIYKICQANPDKAAATGAVAQALGVSPGTVTSMLKTLDEGGLVSYTPYEGVRLSPAGTALALRVLRRHRLIELFLVHTLHLSWDEVHEEAEHIEHAVSDLLINKIDAYLGYPKADPHGDPIPADDGSVEMPESCSLADCSPGERFQLARVLDQSPRFLRFLSEAGLPLGTVGQVVANQPEAEVVQVLVDGKDTTLGRVAAEKIMVVCPVADD